MVITASGKQFLSCNKPGLSSSCLVISLQYDYYYLLQLDFTLHLVTVDRWKTLPEDFYLSVSVKIIFKTPEALHFHADIHVHKHTQYFIFYFRRLQRRGQDSSNFALTFPGSYFLLILMPTVAYFKTHHMIASWKYSWLQVMERPSSGTTRWGW